MAKVTKKDRQSALENVVAYLAELQLEREQLRDSGTGPIQDYLAIWREDAQAEHDRRVAESAEAEEEAAEEKEEEGESEA